MSAFDSSKKLIVETAQSLVQKGYLMATGGNLSLRIAEQNAFAVTPSNYDYMKMTADDVCILDFNLNPLEGELKPSVESAMHGAIYQVRGDVNAVIHTHQVYAKPCLMSRLVFWGAVWTSSPTLLPGIMMSNKMRSGFS
jgi:L-ribulose-5-phosphate 4-epimerase